MITRKPSFFDLEVEDDHDSSREEQGTKLPKMSNSSSVKKMESLFLLSLWENSKALESSTIVILCHRCECVDEKMLKLAITRLDGEPRM